MLSASNLYGHNRGIFVNWGDVALTSLLGNFSLLAELYLVSGQDPFGDTH